VEDQTAARWPSEGFRDLPRAACGMGIWSIAYRDDLESERSDLQTRKDASKNQI
jgi:hypothetical protein